MKVDNLISQQAKHLKLAGILATELTLYLKTPVSEAYTDGITRALFNYNKSIFNATIKEVKK